MKGFRQRRPTGIHEPNLTPLIDVSLVLVVILLVATPFALQSGIGVNGATDSGRHGPADRTARVEITIVDDAHVIVNRSTFARDSLGPGLITAIANSPTHEVVVRCSDRVTHGTFVSVLDQAKRCGAGRIAVVGS